MKKFDIIKPGSAFFLFNKSYECLFAIGGGHDISIWKKGSEYKPYCWQNSFDYEGNQNTLCGKEGSNYPFELKQFIVIQMK